jgi:hypothetical protein
MPEVRWCEAKEGVRGGVREVDGDMNPLRSQRVLVVCWMVALGVVLVEEVGAGQSTEQSLLLFMIV